MSDPETCGYYGDSVQDSWPAGLALAAGNNILVVCHNLNHGECRVVDLDSFEFAPQGEEARFIAINTKGVIREQQPKAIITEGPAGEPALFQANSIIHKVIQRMFGPKAPAPLGPRYLATTRDLPSLRTLTFAEPKDGQSNVVDVSMYKDMPPADPLVPLHLFSYNGCNYVLTSDMNLVRVCQVFPTQDTLVSAFVDGKAPSDSFIVAHTGLIDSDILPDINDPVEALLIHTPGVTLILTLHSIEKHFNAGLNSCLQGSDDIKFMVHDESSAGVPQELSCKQWLEQNGGSDFTPQFHGSCLKPWNTPMLSISDLRPSERVAYPGAWKILQSNIIDHNTVIYGNKPGSGGENVFFLAGMKDGHVYSEWSMAEVKVVRSAGDALYLMTDTGETDAGLPIQTADTFAARKS